MPLSTTVIVRFGPYRQAGVVEYHEERLEGLKNQLSLAGHTVTFERIEDWNVVELFVHGEKVYSCNITELDFSSDGQLDEHCAKALLAVTEAY